MHGLGAEAGECRNSFYDAKVAQPPGSASSPWALRLGKASGMAVACAPRANSWEEEQMVMLAASATLGRLARGELPLVSVGPTWPCFQWLAAARGWGRQGSHSLAPPPGLLTTS